MSVYLEHGYKNRRDYLEQLANEHSVDVCTVFAIANLLGPSEDFDGLVNAVEDWEYDMQD